MDESQKHYAKRKKSDSRNYILNDSVYMILWKRKKLGKKSDPWLLVAGGEGREFITKDYEESSYILILLSKTTTKNLES